MKVRLGAYLLLLLLCSGCAIIGKSIIYSPEATGGTAFREHHVHGGVTKGSAPGHIQLRSHEPDSVVVTITARPIKEKLLFAGIVLPIFPLFFLPGRKCYKEEPGVLIIYISLPADTAITLLPDSMKTIVKDQAFSPIQHNYSKENIAAKLKVPSLSPDTNYFSSKFPREAYFKYEQVRLVYQVGDPAVTDFKFLLNGIYFNDKKLTFSVVGFRKKNQTTKFFGP